MAQRIPISYVDTYSSYDMPSNHPRTSGDISVEVVEGSGFEYEYQPHRQMEAKHGKKQVAPIQTTFYCWKLTKATASKSNDKDAPNWKRAQRFQMTLPSDELATQVKKQCKARSLTDMYEALSTDQRQQVEVLIQEKRRDETNRYASWEIAAVHREIFNNLRTRVRETTFIRVILRRDDKRRANSVSEVSKAPDMASDISDLNDLSSPPLKQVNIERDRYLPAYRGGSKSQQKDRRSHEDVIEVISVPEIFQGSSSAAPPTPPPAPNALLHHQVWQDGALHQDMFRKDQTQRSMPLYQPDRWQTQQLPASQQIQQTQHTQHRSHEQDALAYIAGMKHDVCAGTGGPHQGQQKHTLRSPQAAVHALDVRPLVMQPVLQIKRQPEPQRHQSYPQQSHLSGNQQQDYAVEQKHPYINTQRGGLGIFEAIGVQQSIEQLRRHQTDQLQSRSTHIEAWSPEKSLPAPWNVEHSAHKISTETPSSFEAQPIRGSTDYFGQRIDVPFEVAEPMFVTRTSSMNASAPGADASRYPEVLENRGKSPYKDNQAPVESDWPNYNPASEQAESPVLQPQPRQQANDTNHSPEKLRREDILFWRTQAQLSHSRSSSSLDDQSSTLASPEQSTPPTSVSGERMPMHCRNTDRPTNDIPDQFGRQLAAHEFLRPNSNRQHGSTPVMAHSREHENYKPQTRRGVSFGDQQQQPLDRYTPSPNHQSTHIQNTYWEPSAPEEPTPQVNNKSQYLLQRQYQPQYQVSDNTSMLERLNERLDHMELKQAEGATRKAVEAAQKRRELERKEAYERGIEDAMAWNKVRPSEFGGFE